MSSLTRRQRLILVTMSIQSFFLSACTSVEAPFYPQLANKKSCTQTEIGFVFSIFELVVFIITPLIEIYINKLGIKLIFVGGIFTFSIFCVFFGLLNYLDGHSIFLTISLLVRSIEAVGYGACSIAGYTLIAQEFPQNVGTTSSIVGATASVGVVFGSSIGGILNEYSSYTIPFAVYGVLLFLVAIFASFALPSSDLDSNETSEVAYSIMSTIKLPGVLITVVATITAAISVGFLQTTLEPSIRKYQLKPSTLGLVFVIPRFICAIMDILIGRICDKISSPKIVIIIGTVLQVLSFVILGPAPFIKMKPTLILAIVGLIIHGFGLVTQEIGTFVDILRSFLAEGYEHDLKTNGLLCGTWTAANSLGAFVGPALGGFLVDKVGFSNACMYIVGSQALMGLALFGYVLNNGTVIKYVKLTEEESLLLSGNKS